MNTVDVANETPKRPEETVMLGRIVRPEGGGSRFPAVLCHDPVLWPHLETPWLRAWIGRELGLAPPRRERRSHMAVLNESNHESDLARHCLMVGTSGSGKSRMSELLAGQLFRRGHSLISLEPKLSTIRQIAAQAQAAGLSPEQITVVSPRAPGGSPGWNPFLNRLPAAENASDFVAVIAGNATSWGPRLADILANVALIVATHRLSLYELMQALRTPDYLQALLDRPLTGRPSAAYREAADALALEFLAGSKSARTEAVGAVTNKIREALRNDFLRDLLTARANTLDLSLLWKRQGVVLVHLDRASLGEAGAKLLAGMIASSLFRISLRVTGPIPVNFALDEISTTEHFVGEILENIAVFSRSANLRLLAAAQNISQLGGRLREALLSANVQISFRLSPSDSRLVAASLAAGTEPSIARVRAEASSPARHGGLAPRSMWRHRLLDESGRPLRLDPATWTRLQTEELFRLPDGRGASSGDDPLGAISRLAARHGLPRLYVRAADTGEPIEVHRYVAGVSPTSYWVDGPQPLALVVSFPTPRLTGAERRGEADAVRAWTRILQGLPVQHAVLRVGGGEPVIMRVADVPETALANIGPYLAAALQANGQSAKEILACADERRKTVRRLARGERDPAADGNGALDGNGTLDRSGQERRPMFRTRPERDAQNGTNNADKQQSGENFDADRSDTGTASGQPPFPLDDADFADDGSLG